MAEQTSRMHESVLQWVEHVVRTHKLAERSTLELGSWNINGSVRGYFTGPYLGIDIGRGPSVDAIASSWHLPFGDAVFENVVSTEMIEHDLYPWLTFAEAVRVLQPGGRFIVTGRGYDERGVFEVHKAPEDHWRYSLSGIKGLCAYVGLHIIQAKRDPQAPGVFIHARRQ